jgi:hypothetical protein
MISPTMSKIAQFGQKSQGILRIKANDAAENCLNQSFTCLCLPNMKLKTNHITNSCAGPAKT